MSCAIRAFGLTKRFHRTPVLDGFDLEAPEGSMYALTGRNGAGKTTAIKILMNMLAPGGGRCEVLGADSRLPGSAGDECLGGLKIREHGLDRPVSAPVSGRVIADCQLGVVDCADSRGATGRRPSILAEPSNPARELIGA